MIVGFFWGGGVFKNCVPSGCIQKCKFLIFKKITDYLQINVYENISIYKILQCWYWAPPISPWWNSSREYFTSVPASAFYDIWDIFIMHYFSEGKLVMNNSSIPGCLHLAESPAETYQSQQIQWICVMLKTEGKEKVLGDPISSN